LTLQQTLKNLKPPINTASLPRSGTKVTVQRF
jgi:hypothetical protein